MLMVLLVCVFPIDGAMPTPRRQQQPVQSWSPRPKRYRSSRSLPWPIPGQELPIAESIFCLNTLCTSVVFQLWFVTTPAMNSLLHTWLYRPSLWNARIANSLFSQSHFGIVNAKSPELVVMTWHSSMLGAQLWKLDVTFMKWRNTVTGSLREFKCLFKKTAIKQMKSIREIQSNSRLQTPVW